MALDARTGKRVWHFQAVHHGVWDYDFPAAPMLVDIKVNGKPIKAVAQVSKQGFTYVFDRRLARRCGRSKSGRCRNRRCPANAPSPTQPFPTKPPAFERQGVTESELIDFTPELKQAALEAVKEFDYGPLFTPPSERGTIQNPGWAGGANWAGGGVRSGNRHAVCAVDDQPDRGAADQAEPGAQQPALQPRRHDDAAVARGLPILKPPYGRVTAVDLNRGETKWTQAIGDGPRNHPLLKDLNLPAMGLPIRNAALVTKSLLFVMPGSGNLGGGRNLPVGGRPLTKMPIEPTKIRALDKATGATLWEFDPPSRPLAAPMTYMLQGKQYLVVAAGGGLSAELIAFSLPQ